MAKRTSNKKTPSTLRQDLLLPAIRLSWKITEGQEESEPPEDKRALMKDPQYRALQKALKRMDRMHPHSDVPVNIHYMTVDREDGRWFVCTVTATEDNRKEAMAEELTKLCEEHCDSPQAFRELRRQLVKLTSIPT